MVEKIGPPSPDGSAGSAGFWKSLLGGLGSGAGSQTGLQSLLKGDWSGVGAGIGSSIGPGLLGGLAFGGLGGSKGGSGLLQQMLMSGLLMSPFTPQTQTEIDKANKKKSTTDEIIASGSGEY